MENAFQDLHDDLEDEELEDLSPELLARSHSSTNTSSTPENRDRPRTQKEIMMEVSVLRG